ncbi:MAG: Ig-like domain-containing protein [Gemmatimonadota bacterium]
MRLYSLVACVVGLAACGGDDSVGTSPVTLALRAPQPQMVSGETSQLEVTVTRNGQPAATDRVTFTSSSASIASVSTQGLVTAIAPGTVTLTAQLDGQRATTTVSVLQGGLLTPAGGIVRTAGGEIELTVPAGAVGAITPLPMTLSVSPPWVDPTLVRGSVFTVGRDAVRFSKPLSIRVRYNVANGPYGLPQSALGLRRAGASGTWIDLRPSVVDSSAGTVSASIDETGTYSVGRLVPTTPCVGDAYRAFDFWVGSWNMTNGNQSAGENFITAESSGCAIFENYITATNLSPGRSVSFYNAVTDRWYQTYIDAGNNMVLLRSTSYDPTRIPMESPIQNNTYTRTTWSRNVDGSVRQLIEVTANNGQTFVVQYDLLYRRK